MMINIITEEKKSDIHQLNSNPKFSAQHSYNSTEIAQ